MNHQKLLIIFTIFGINFEGLNCQESDVFVLNSENFQDSLLDSSFVYAKFFSAKCPFSRKIEPVWLETASALKSSTIKVAELECIGHKKLCEKENVFSYPTIKMYKDGMEIGTFDTDKFIVNTENLVEFANGFLAKYPGRNLVPNRNRGYAKCLGR